MGKHRSKLQIVADILFAVRNNAKKTQIMRQANLSYKLLGQYLSFVIEAGFVRFKDANSYTLTSSLVAIALILAAVIAYPHMRKSRLKS